jgi:hypothetical protein
MENLEKALSFANYQSTLTQQKKVIKQRFDDACVFPWNGGLFQLTLEFLGGLQSLQTNTGWVVDMNGNPIWISDAEFFCQSAYKQYTDAVTIYGTAYEELKKQRSVNKLVGI